MMDQFDVIDDEEFKQLYEDAKSVFGNDKKETYDSSRSDQDDLDPMPVLSEKEKRMMYDLFVSKLNEETNEPAYSNEELADKFKVDVKTVKAVLMMQQIVREAEAAGEIQVEEDLQEQLH